MKKKVLITGGAGYFGESLLNKLLEKGYECSVLDINIPDKSILDKINFFKTDIRNYNGVLNASKGIDYIFHNVAQVPLAKDKELFDSVNNIGTMNIVKAAVANGCQHLVYTSSSAVYGIPPHNPVNEMTPTNPVEEYGQAKLDGEKMCLDYKDKMDITIIRPRTILGNGRLGIFQILFEWVYLNQNLPVFDGGHNIYQFVHCDDLSEACIKSVEEKATGVFNIGTNDYCSMKETLNTLIKHSKKNSKITSLPSKIIVPLMNLSSYLGLSPLGPYHSAMYGNSLYFDTSKAKKELKWSSKNTNQDMIKESYDWYLSNRDELLTNTNQKSLHKSKVKQGILYIIGKFL
tara:strand:- start:3587 stop:4624 length:1038 start_codon:yes stop_codon:yes gene_type:complete